MLVVTFIAPAGAGHKETLIEITQAEAFAPFTSTGLHPGLIRLTPWQQATMAARGPARQQPTTTHHGIARF